MRQAAENPEIVKHVGKLTGTSNPSFNGLVSFAQTWGSGLVGVVVSFGSLFAGFQYFSNLSHNVAELKTTLGEIKDDMKAINARFDAYNARFDRMLFGTVAISFGAPVLLMYLKEK